MGTSTKGLNLASKVSVSKLGKAYKPAKNTAQGNGATWETINKLLAKPQTVATLTAAIKEQHNHAPFVGYAIRRGWLQVG